MTTQDPHNLFTYATSELSQDAWLSWLLAHVEHDERPELRDAARDLVARMWNAARPGEAVLPSEVGGPVHVERQWQHVDVLARLRVRGRAAVLLIEDKTATTHHGGQLERYRKVVEASWPEAAVVPVYFKTGYHFESDAAAREAGFVVVGLEELVDLLDLHAPRVRSDIFADYAAFQRRALEERRAALAALDGPDGYVWLGHDFAQHAFLARLRAAALAPGDRTVINRGANLDGTPWTHWQFGAARAPLPGGIGETLFHRVDARKGPTGVRRYYLCTRQYAAVRRHLEARRAKVARLAEHRRRFAEAAAGADLGFAPPSADHRGANESEIGIVFFDAGPSSTANVLRLFPDVHQRFVASLRAAGVLDA